MFRYYTEFINKRNDLSKTKDISDLDNLKNFLFLSIVKVLIPLGFFVGTYNIALAILNGEYVVAFFDVLANVLLLVLVFSKKIPMRIKRYGLLINLYLLSVVLVVMVGEKGPGLIWLLGISVMVTGLGSVRLGYLNILLNTVVLSALFILSKLDVLNIPGYSSNSNTICVVIVSNFVLISFITVYSTGHLIRGLNKNLIISQRTQANLKAREAQLSVMYQSINEAVIMVDTNNRIKGMNYRAEALTGYTLDEAYNRQLSSVYFVEGSGRNVLIGSKYFTKATLMSKSGVHHEIEESITNLEHSKDQIYNQVIVFRDMTGYNKVENELRQSHKMQAMGQLAGGIAHDFNNMLTGILGYAELIEIENQANVKIDRYCKIIIDSSRRAADLTSQLLSFSRKDITDLIEVELNGIIENGIRLLERTLHPNINITKELTSTKLPILGDKAQLENIILNLGINARDAMPTGGQLIFISEEVVLGEAFCSISKFDIIPGRYAKITINDDGSGISADIIERIFDPFFTTKEVGEGTGLGLSTVYGAMIAHKGALDVESDEKNGTTFQLYFPVAQSGSEIEINHILLDALTMKPDAKVLIIEDEIKVRDLVQSMVEFIGFKCTVAHNGAEGINMFMADQASICLVILDSVLPLKNGKDTLKAIRKINKAIPIIMTVDHLEENEGLDINEMNVNGYLHKPFNLKELTHIILKSLNGGDGSDKSFSFFETGSYE